MSSQWSGPATQPPNTSPWKAPARVWRYREANKTVGLMMLGHTQKRIVSALDHAIYTSINEVSSPLGFITAGATYVMNPYGANAEEAYTKQMKAWDEMLGYIKQNKAVQVRDIPLSKVVDLLTNLRTDVLRFFQSSNNRTILYYHWPKELGPVVVPYYTIASPPTQALLRLSKNSLLEQRLKTYGTLYYRQKLRRALPAFNLLLNKYMPQNKRSRKLLFPAQLQCKYTWYKLFELVDSTIKMRNVHLSYREVNTINPQQERRIFCRDKSLERFKQDPRVIRKVRIYRQELMDLNRSFRSYVGHHTLALKRLDALSDLSISTAIDGLLRRHTLYYNEKIRLNGKVVDPNELFDTWQKQRFKETWQQIHKQAQDAGQYFNTVPTDPAGIFRFDHVVFWTKALGPDYVIAPKAIMSGSFAVVLDRTRGIIEIVTPYKPFPFAAKRSIKDDKKPAQAPPARQSLRKLIEANAGKEVTLVYATGVKDLPNPLPTIPMRTFLFQDGFVWIRLQKTMTVIPVKAGNALSAAQQKSIVRQVEEEMKQRDAIPDMIQILTVSGTQPQIAVHFPGDAKLKKQKPKAKQ